MTKAPSIKEALNRIQDQIAGPRAINHFNLSFKIYLISNNTPAQNQTPPPTTSIAANSISIPHKNAKPISITTDITPLIVIIHIIGSDIAFNS